MMGQVLKDRRLLFGTLPVNMLDRSSLSPMARLLWGVLDSCGTQHAAASLPFLALRMGLHPENKRTVHKYLRELVDGGFLEIEAGHRGAANIYRLQLPDYCYVDSPQILQAALQAPLDANRTGWKAAKGRPGAPRQKKATVDRLAWFSRRKKQHQERQQGQLDLSGGAVSSEHRPGTAPVSSEHRGQCSVDTGPVSSEHPKKEGVRTERNVGGSAAGAPPQAALSKDETPAGWTTWAAAYERAHGRPWRWTKRTRQQALQLNALVDLALVPGTLSAFLQDPFWHKKGHPLAGLLAQVQDYVPAAPAAPAHKHQLATSTARADQDGRPGTWTTSSCSSCGYVASRVFHADPTPEEQKRMDEFMDQLRRKAAARA